jgi:Fur family peroxide stress response transcriptional regulator
LNNEKNLDLLIRHAELMRHADSKSESSAAEAPDLRRALDQAGKRFTRQRAAVYDCLKNALSHPTAEQVYLSVRHQIPNISLATIYKALEALVDAGVANKLANADGPARYDCRCGSHYHLRCVKSGEVRDLSTPFDPDLLNKIDPKLVESLRAQGFEVTDYRLEILGQFKDG